MQTNVFLKGALLTDVLGWISLQRFLLTSRTLLVECPEEVSNCLTGVKDHMCLNGAQISTAKGGSVYSESTL